VEVDGCMHIPTAILILTDTHCLHNTFDSSGSGSEQRVMNYSSKGLFPMLLIHWTGQNMGRAVIRFTSGCTGRWRQVIVTTGHSGSQAQGAGSGSRHVSLYWHR
jgi:hypothetical protein